MADRWMTGMMERWLCGWGKTNGKRKGGCVERFQGRWVGGRTHGQSERQNDGRVIAQRW
jgi:hypothetical protein